MLTNDRYARQSFLGADSERILAASTLTIIGAGGGGSHVGQQAAHVGIGTFEVFDGDFMEDVNLNRTVGSEPRHADEKVLKVDVAEELIKRINPLATVNKHPCKWEEDHLALRRTCAVVGCLDGFAARDALEKYCRRYHLPYIDIGMDVHEIGKHFLITGQVITSMPGGPCMRCLGFLTDELVSKEVRAYGAAGGRPQVIWSNGVLASTAVGIFMRMRCNWSGRTPVPYLEYDGNADMLRPSHRARLPEGWVCQHFHDSNDLGDGIWSEVASNC